MKRGSLMSGIVKFLRSVVFPPLLLLGAVTVVIAAPGDIRLERKGDVEGSGSFSPAVFPHWVHRINYRCDACHDSLFQMKSGATEISMELMAKGESCGSCHNGKAAFDTSLQNCDRCHTRPE